MNYFQIIVPTLNSYLLLNRLVNSLKSQTWENWEVIFIDGNSKKDHVKWLKKLCTSDKRFIYKKQIKKNSGIFGAMNEGLKYSENKKWLFFWGSDDWLIDKFTLEEINNKINELSPVNPDLIIFKGIYYDVKSNKNSRKAFFINNTKDIILGTKDYNDLLYKGNTPPHQTTLINSEITNELGFFYDLKYKIAGDLDFFCRLGYKNNLKFAIVNEYILYIASGGISGRFHQKRINEVIRCYFIYFKIFFFIPLILRYMKRLKQIL